MEGWEDECVRVHTRTLNEQPYFDAGLGIPYRDSVAPEREAGRTIVCFPIACVKNLRPLPFVPGL